MTGYEFDEAISQLANGESVFNYEALHDKIVQMISLLDDFDSEGQFGTQGWKYSIGIKE